MQKFVKFLKTDLGELLVKAGKEKTKRKHQIYSNGVVFLAFVFLLCGFLWGLQGKQIFSDLFIKEKPLPTTEVEKVYQSVVSWEQAVMGVVQKASPAVVSIVIYKDMPVYETYYEKQYQDFGSGIGIEFEVPKTKQKGTEKKQISSGTGFFVSQDGMVITNKHVVLDDKAEFTIVTSDNIRYQAKVLAKDPFYDLAVLKIDLLQEIDEQGSAKNIVFPVLPLADSDGLQIGQTVIAIGNALGEFNNTVSVGVISGLKRRITGEGAAGYSDILEDVIQTDAAINKGNSGGPLLNLRGDIVGVNSAMAESAQSIGFAIPINDAKRAIIQVRKEGRIVYPFLGVVYQLVTLELQEREDISVDYGAWIVNRPNEYAIIKGSAAEKAGLEKGDIILAVDGKRVDTTQTLAKLIRRYLPGDRVVLEVLRNEEYLSIEVVLGEKSSDE